MTELSSPVAEARHAAQRWLEAHLREGDYPDVAAAVRGANAETRRRLVQVLGADDARLGLCALLIADPEPGVGSLGREGVRALVRRWSESAFDPPGGRSVLPADWTSKGGRVLALELWSEDGAGPLARLDRLGDARAPVES